MGKEIKVEANIENLEKVVAFLDEQLDAVGCPMKIHSQMNIVVDELYGNIARYAYPGKKGMASLSVEFIENPGRIRMTFRDEGIPFNPLKMLEADTTLSLEERQLGGLGIHLVKKMTDAMDYSYENGQNVLVVWKNINGR